MSTTDSTSGLDEDSLEMVYGWVDEVPLTRPKKNIARDFSDGVLFAEMIHYYFPKLVEMHNYSPRSNISGKLSNWSILNRKVLRKLNFELADDVINNLCKSTPFIIEKVLMELKTRIEKKMKEDKMEPPPPLSSFRAKENDQPEADQHFGWKGKGAKGQKSSSKASAELPAPPAFERVTHKNLGRKDPIMPSSMPRRQKGGVKKEQDLTILYEEKVQECLTKDEAIAVLQAKTRRLEHLLQLKDIRLEELQGQIERLRPTGGIK